MNVSQNKRRDWSLIIFILPLGVVMMMCVGQLAIRMAPNWSVDGNMNSSLDPETVAKQNALIIPPVSSGILTPMSWWDTFLTPSGDSGGGVVFPPFITFEPSLTPTASASPTLTTSPTPTSSVTITPTRPTNTPTKKPTNDNTTPTPPATCKNPAASNFGGPLPCTFPPTTCTDPLATNNGGPLPCTYPPTTCTDPLATNNGGPLPCVYPPTTCTDPLATNNGGPLPCVYPPTTCTDPLATNNGGPLPCVYPPTTCTDPLATNNGGPLPCVYPPPVGNQVGSPPNLNVGPPDGNIANINNGDYVVLDLAGNPIVVNGTSDTNYDFVYYELYRPGTNDIAMDSVILSISVLSGGPYYVVFNWGDGVPDNNSNVGDVTTSTGTEADNQSIASSELHGTAPLQTGITVDVDNAPSAPPPGSYQYLAIQAPAAPVVDGGLDVDSIEVTEVPP